MSRSVLALRTMSWLRSDLARRDLYVVDLRLASWLVRVHQEADYARLWHQLSQQSDLFSPKRT